MDKDGVLFELSQSVNVARFFSVDRAGLMRHCAISAEHSPANWTSALEDLIGKAGAVNVRSFTAEQPSGNPFIYGLTDAPGAEAAVRELLAAGYNVIVNETIDVNDGGVSGVVDGDVCEFAPGATPRVVESGNAASMPRSVARDALRCVYGVDIASSIPDGSRIEFSVHPQPVGLWRTPVLVWERSESTHNGESLATVPAWPNDFSRAMGDKCFGLLMAHLFGFVVPYTMAVTRRIGAFAFGQRLEAGGTWTRTSPSEFSAGEFPTLSGVVDPFDLLSRTPGSDRIASVLFQDGVSSEFSGAALVTHSDFLVDGTVGAGDQYMLGGRSGHLPLEVSNRVEHIANKLRNAFGPVRFEWAVAKGEVWVLQLNQIQFEGETLPLAVGGYVDFRAGSSLTTLQDKIGQARERGYGIRLLGSVGLTSHVADLLRRSGLAVVDKSGAPWNGLLERPGQASLFDHLG